MKADSVVDLVFGRDLLSVSHADGAVLHFTRQERALLMRLIESPGRLLTREALIAALGEAGEPPAGDRHVDFLINQLRRKLRDDARAPRMIKTQYGEGYCWVGDVAPPTDGPMHLLRIGTVYGDHLPGAAELVGGLVSALRSRLEPARFDGINGGRGRGVQAHYQIEMSLHDTGQQLQAALVLRHGVTGAILDSFRVLTGPGVETETLLPTADAILRSIWTGSALPSDPGRMAPGEAPPWVRMFEAALMMDGDILTWKSNATRLEAMLAEDPDNSAMEVMRGLNLYTWLIQSFYDPSGRIVGAAQWRAVEDDIESIALAGLSRFEGQPVMQLAVAKLLLFVNRGYLHLSRSIAEDAISSSSAHASAFALAGEAAGFAGDIEAGTMLLERALEFSSAGSQFQLYLLVVEASALLAANERAGFERICKLTRDVSPEAYATLQAFCALPGYETAPLFTHVLAPNAERAGEAIRFLWNVTGRRFAHRNHRRNFMRPLTAALVQRHGPAVVPDEVELGTGLAAELGAGRPA